MTNRGQSTYNDTINGVYPYYHGAEEAEQSNSVVSTEVLSSTTTGARARTREGNEVSSEARMKHGMYLDACMYYAESFRRSITPVIQRQLAELIRGGMTGDVIHAAIDETQLAPRPSWAYCSAILRRCENQGIRTLEDWNADKERYRSSINPALNYAQRSYSEQDFDALYFDLEKEYGNH